MTRYTVLVDTREQRPLPLKAPILRKKLRTGDYSLLGAETRCAFERKNRHDFVSGVRANRDRFERQIERLAAYRWAAVIVEASYHDFDQKFWRSDATVSAVKNSIAAWSLRIPIIFCGSARGAADHLDRVLGGIATVIARENQHITIQEDELCLKRSM